MNITFVPYIAKKKEKKIRIVGCKAKEQWQKIKIYMINYKEKWVIMNESEVQINSDV
jgi:hypothetical protein